MITKIRVTFKRLELEVELEEGQVLNDEGVEATVVDLLRDMVQEGECPPCKWEVVK